MDPQGRSHMDLSLRNLSASMCYLGRPPRPANRASSGLRLQPLGTEAPAAPSWSNPLQQIPANDVLDSHVALSQSPQLCRSPSGRLAVVRSMRRSVPSLARHSFPPDATQAQGLSDLPWSRMAELAAPQTSEPKRTQKDIRLRRSRRPADFGASLPLQARRGQSCAASSSSNRTEMPGSNIFVGLTAREEDHDTSLGECPEPPGMSQSSSSAPAVKRCAARSESLPPTGTSKADSDAAAAAKSKAVSMLQRLFFEEMAKGSQDPSGAAAAALLRLSEAPQQPLACAPEVKATPISMVPPAEVEVLAEAPEPEIEAQVERHSAVPQQPVAAFGARPFMPQRPTEKLGARRPRALSRTVAVRS